MDTTSPTGDDLFTVEEAAQRLRLAKSTLNKLRSAGAGPAYSKMGRAVRYRRRDLDNWVTTHLRRSTSDLTASV